MDNSNDSNRTRLRPRVKEPEGAERQPAAFLQGNGGILSGTFKVTCIFLVLFIAVLRFLICILKTELSDNTSQHAHINNLIQDLYVNDHANVCF